MAHLQNQNMIIVNMLNFAAKQVIFTLTEKSKFSTVNEAMERLHDGKVGYRNVLTN